MICSMAVRTIVGRIFGCRGTGIMELITVIHFGPRRPGVKILIVLSFVNVTSDLKKVPH